MSGIKTKKAEFTYDDYDNEFDIVINGEDNFVIFTDKTTKMETAVPIEAIKSIIPYINW